jgi:hypothetical protein
MSNNNDSNEIEITPEMVEAGFLVLCNSGIADSYLKADKTLVAEIFRAMFAALSPQAQSSRLIPKQKRC